MHVRKCTLSRHARPNLVNFCDHEQGVGQILAGGGEGDDDDESEAAAHLWEVPVEHSAVRLDATLQHAINEPGGSYGEPRNRSMESVSLIRTAGAQTNPKKISDASVLRTPHGKRHITFAVQARHDCAEVYIPAVHCQYALPVLHKHRQSPLISFVASRRQGLPQRQAVWQPSTDVRLRHS